MNDMNWTSLKLIKITRSPIEKRCNPLSIYEIHRCNPWNSMWRNSTWRNQRYWPCVVVRPKVALSIQMSFRVFFELWGGYVGSFCNLDASFWVIFNQLGSIRGSPTRRYIWAELRRRPGSSNRERTTRTNIPRYIWFLGPWIYEWSLDPPAGAPSFFLNLFSFHLRSSFA